MKFFQFFLLAGLLLVISCKKDDDTNPDPDPDPQPEETYSLTILD